MRAAEAIWPSSPPPIVARATSPSPARALSILLIIMMGRPIRRRTAQSLTKQWGTRPYCRNDEHLLRAGRHVIPARPKRARKQEYAGLSVDLDGVVDGLRHRFIAALRLGSPAREGHVISGGLAR